MLKNIVLPLLLSFLVAAISGVFIIPKLRELKFGQTVRDEGPQSHLSKNGTPTMGGIMIILGILFSTVLFGGLNYNTLILLISTLGFGLVGFLDDYIKVVKRRSLGLTAKQKIVIQVLFATLIPLSQYINNPSCANLIVPFVEKTLSLGILYVPFMAFVLIGTVNAVNLTDGLDGLSSTVTVIVGIFFAIISMNVGFGEMSVFSVSVIGACLGFLIYNKYPAKVFMGDTGSMALGGAVVGMALLTNSVLMIPIVGGIYFAEALSVIIQVASFKMTGKRVFKMAPIHHHFEQCGYEEVKVVNLFTGISIILLIIGLIAM